MRKFLLGLLVMAILLGVNIVTLAEEPKITIHYEDDSQFELISREGTRVLIDVSDTSRLSSPMTDKDILLMTHIYYEPAPNGLNYFSGKQLYVKAGELAADGVKITGIASSCNDAEELIPEGGTNYIFIIEMDGIRIVHFGIVGQNEFIPEQLKSIGEVDIALTQFANVWLNININNRKGFNLMDQVKPKLIIPTHLDSDTAAYAAKKWQAFYGEKTLQIEKTDLTGATKFVMLGINGILGEAMKLGPHWK